jgi:hypothetical protein
VFLLSRVVHRGQSPTEAELQYLENAKKLSLYGVHIHYAKVRPSCLLVCFQRRRLLAVEPLASPALSVDGEMDDKLIDIEISFSRELTPVQMATTLLYAITI